MLETLGRIEPGFFEEHIPTSLANLSVEIQRAAGTILGEPEQGREASTVAFIGAEKPDEHMPDMILGAEEDSENFETTCRAISAEPDRRVIPPDEANLVAHLGAKGPDTRGLGQSIDL